MANSSLIQLIKQMAVEAVRASKPCDYIVGSVTETDPLKIKVSNTLILEEEFLDLTRNGTDYETVVSITKEYDWKTQDKSGGSGYSAFETHSHDIVTEKKKIKIHNALKADDKVLMLRKSGGQEFIVIDRMVTDDTE